MFFLSYIQLDPRESTVIKSNGNESFFNNLKSIFLRNNYDKKIEQETFTAISIIQKINTALMDLGIKNIIKLSVDNYDYYHDIRSKDEDLELAFAQLKFKIDPLSSKLFENIEIVLEHHDIDFKYYIDITINRQHIVNEYPINIRVIGFFKEFQISKDNREDNVIKKMELLFQSQKYYTGFINYKEMTFSNFVNSINFKLGDVIKVDGIKKNIIQTYIRPDKIYTDYNQILNLNIYGNFIQSHPLIYNFSFYTWFWVEKLFLQNIKMENCLFLDQEGNAIFSVKNIGFSAQDTQMLNINEKFIPYKVGFLKYYKNSIYDDIIMQNGLLI